MKRITVMRHAHAEPQRGDREDAARELDARGRTEAGQMAALAITLGLRPDPLLASPAARTRATAAALADAFRLEPGQLRLEPRIYNASLEALIELLRELPRSSAEVLLVGHNPGVSELVGWLAGKEPRRMPPAGLCTLEATLAQWSEIDSGLFVAARLRWPGEAAARG